MTTQRGHHSWSSSWSGVTPAIRPGHTCGATCAHLLPLVLPSQPPAPGAGPAPWSARRRARRRSLCGSEAAARVCRRHSCDPRSADTRASLPARPVRTATTKPLADHSDTSNPVGTTWAEPHRPIPGSSTGWTARMQRLRTPERCPSGHPNHAGRVDTGRPPAQWTDVRPADSGRGQGDKRRVRPPDILDGHGHGDRRLAGQFPVGLPRLRRSATHDGSAVTIPAAAALTAAATEQPRSAARHEAAPRRTALVCWIWMVREEGNGTTEGGVSGVGLVREC